MNARKRMIMAAYTLLSFSTLLLAITYYTAIIQKSDALTMALAGRQRMLSQKISKEYFFLNMVSRPNKALELEIENDIKIFEATQRALLNGGDAPLTMDPSGPAQHLSSASGQAFVVLNEASSIADRLFSHISYEAQYIPLINEKFNNATEAKLINVLDAAIDILQSQLDSKIILLLRSQKITLAVSLAALTVLTTGLFINLLRPLRLIKSSVSQLKGSMEILRGPPYYENLLRLRAKTKPISIYLKILFMLFIAVIVSGIVPILIRQSQTYDAAKINLASRQGMLTQKICKEFLLLKTAINPKEHKKISEQLLQSISIFKISNSALLFGGKAPSTLKPDGQQVYVSKPTNGIFSKLLAMEKEMNSFILSVTPVQDNRKAPEAPLNSPLLLSLNELVEDLQHQAENTVYYEKTAQQICFFITLISFLGTIFIVRRKLLMPLIEAIDSVTLTATKLSYNTALKDAEHLKAINALKIQAVILKDFVK